MLIVWDRTKSALNRLKHGRGFEDAKALMQGRYSVTLNKDRGEERWELWGYLDSKPWLLVLTVTPDGERRILSLRRANKREERDHYGKG